MAKQTLRAECLKEWMKENNVIQRAPRQETEPVDASRIFDILTNIKKARRK